MRVIVGTSGYSYKEWKGTFYPDGLPASQMLPFYARHFGAVEINNTFYKMPSEELIAKWASEVPDGFTFVLKAPRWIMQLQRDTGPAVDRFFAVGAVLGAKLGPALFRPPYAKNVDSLRAFLGSVPPGRRVCLEFRHESWVDDEVYEALRAHDAALCIADTDEVADPDQLLVPTASWGYLRLRRTEYSDEQLAAWVKRIKAQPWTDAYVFFKHEDEGKGPQFAKRFLECLR
jgi:uncharacterized protein YecE (DUF72 family)